MILRKSMILLGALMLFGCPPSAPDPAPEPVTPDNVDDDKPKPPNPEEFCLLKDADECHEWIFEYHVNKEEEPCITHWNGTNGENVLDTCQTIDWCESWASRHKLEGFNCYRCRNIDPYAGAVNEFLAGKSCPPPAE